jgi:carbon monoxide dehydrogenase subunit G
MRWFLGLVLVVALIAGALYGVGRFLLPNALEVTRSTNIDRPRAAVFAMANDLRIVKEWSPYYARDPDADYAISETPGEGQSMRWVSTVREVGSGRMSIVGSTENEQVETILELADRATLNARMELRRTNTETSNNATNVAWSVSAECAEGAINVPCRYMNLVLRQMIERDLDSGLTRLKTLTEQLPNVDFEGLTPDSGPIEAQTFVYSVVNTVRDNQVEVDRAEAMGLDQVRRFMAENQMVASGPLVRVVTEDDPSQNRMSFRVGYPFAGPTPLSVVGVQIGQTPSGSAMHVLVEGSRAQVNAAYLQMYAYMQAHRIPLREDGRPWEIVHEAGAADGSAPTRIEIFMPLN